MDRPTVSSIQCHTVQSSHKEQQQKTKTKSLAPAGRIAEIGYSNFTTKVKYPNEPSFQTL